MKTGGLAAEDRTGSPGLRRGRWPAAVARLGAVLACFVLLASCFVPDQYETEVRFSKTGAYGITFVGILTYAPLYSEIAKGHVDDADAQIRGHLEQLKRDSSFKDAQSLGQGRYQVRYSREGQFLGEHQMVTFVNRQEPIFRLRTFADGRISIAASGAGRQYAARLAEVGLTTHGLFRVVTDAEVIEHNAQFVRASSTPGFTVYDWNIRSFSDEPPRLVARLTVDPKTGAAPRNVENDTSANDDAELEALAKKRVENK